MSLLVLGDDVEAESFVNGLRDFLYAGLETEGLVGHNLGRCLVVGDHAEEAARPLVVAVVLVPCCTQGLLLLQEEVPSAGVHLIQGSRINGLL